MCSLVLLHERHMFAPIFFSFFSRARVPSENQTIIDVTRESFLVRLILKPHQAHSRINGSTLQYDRIVRNRVSQFGYM